ncbi:hypothetical protein Nham_3072 [Nitrobacter hamburgensis X14]|uniref:Uncharacterized protein n=1 Tax=Nitrobacter hamburgensis (strain DSM 10229 / NCIMB 13809 / X14) TaxID=323097 RepID=Q1QIY5_NITHX|nr:hypothetical protein [Nitrobacter hamburgensis]ABE63812.1 hypothetical protein Nham_3072 [Nitrobacter hamburgensis X14]
MIIRYRFHPRYGETVIATGGNRHGDEVALIIRQPDGTLAQLPIWMTEDRAEAMMVTESPRLPLTYLRELRLELDAGLTLLRDDSRREGGDKHEASAILSPPIRSLRAQEPTGADSTGRVDEAGAAGERAVVGSIARRRSDGGRR